MQRSRRRGAKFRPVPLQPRDKLQEADSYCISCGSRTVVIFRQTSVGNVAGQRLIKCQCCGVVSPDFSQSKPRPGVRDDYTPLDKARAQQMADQVLDAFTHQRIKRKLQRALGFAQGDLGLICHKYLPVAIEVFAHVVSRFGFTESIEGVTESVRVMQNHAKDDEQLVLKLISIRKILTPTANWIQEDEDAEKDEERRREQEQVVIQQKMEEERRQELHALENAKKARLRAKKIAMGLDPSVERPPVLVDVPPPIVAAIENASLELRVNAKYVQKFRWFFNGRPIESESFVAGINRSTLIIPKLTKRVVGEYFCTCKNEEGTVSTPTCRVSLAVLRLSRLASKVLGTLSTSPIYACDRGMIVACVGGKLNYSDAKTLSPAKVFPALPTAMEALAWDPQTKILAAFSASKKMDEPAQVLFYSLERPAAGPSSDNSPAAPNRRRNNSILALSLKPKVPLLSTSAKFQLVNVQPVKAVTEVHAAEFVDNGKMLLVTDMMHTVAIYDLSPSFAGRNIISFDRDVVCHMSASLRGPVLFSLAFRNKPFVKFYRNITINTSNNANPAEEVINFKFPVHRISFDASGFFLAVAETGFMKSWISIVNVSTKKPSSKRFIAHTGRISGLQWTTSTALLISSSLDGYVKVWDPIRMSSLMSVHVDTYGIHSMLLMEELAVLVVLGYSDCRLQSRLILQLSELEASRLVELNKQAANIQKIWKGGKTREIIAKYIRGPGT